MAARLVPGGDAGGGTPALVVEDDMLIAWGLEAVLDSLGFRPVVVATTGGSALGAAETTAFGLIVCDLNLGPLTVSGVELLTLIDPDEAIPTIIYTAYDNPDIDTALRRSRPRAVKLIKPVPDATFAAAVVRLLAGNGQEVSAGANSAQRGIAGDPLPETIDPDRSRNLDERDAAPG